MSAKELQVILDKISELEDLVCDLEQLSGSRKYSKLNKIMEYLAVSGEIIEDLLVDGYNDEFEEFAKSKKAS